MTSTEGERRLAAIMYTDIVGYTALGQRNEALSLALVKEQRNLIRPILTRHNGREIKTIGDAFLVEFPNALDAVRCAYDIQRATREFNVSLSTEKRIHLRIGLHLGDVVESQGDISGDAVNVASRIEPLAEDGGVCITRQVYDHVSNKFELPLASLGPKVLKNVTEPMEVYKMEMPWEQPTAPKEPLVLPRNRIAILPFANMSPDPQDEYFADGMTEEVISTLSKVKDFEVISRTSVMQYKRSPKPVTEVSRELHAGSVLEGSIRKADNRLRVTVQLIDASKDRHLWADSYDRELRDVFAIQGDIASRVADALKVELLATEKRNIGKPLTQNVVAHTIYLKDVYHLNKGTPIEIDKAIEYFQLACEQDPEFALAYARTAEAYVLNADTSMPSSVALPKAKDCVAKALSLDDSLAEAHLARATIANQYDWDWEMAERGFKKALSLNPSLTEAHLYYAWFLSMKGRFSEAATEEALAYSLAPVSPVALGFCAQICLIAGRWDEMRGYVRKALELSPDSAGALLMLGWLNAAEGRLGEAVKAADEAIGISDEAWFRGFQAQIYALAGLKDRAREVLDGLLSNRFKGYPSPAQIGVVYYILGEKDEGFHWMEKAYNARDTSLAMNNNLPALKAAREDKRFIELLGRMGLS